MRLALHVILLGGVAAAASADVSRDYEDHIKPLLRARCYACHGALKQNAGLRVDTAANLLKGSKTQRQVLVPGRPDESVLLHRITATDHDERMPPEGERLTPRQIALIRKWIDAGAAAPKDEAAERDPRSHWAFQPVKRPAVPSTDYENPIDALIAANQDGNTPTQEASRLVLLRRLYIDLIGLPPTVDQIAAIEQDQSPHWYTRVVDRLLKDPRHGERWARHWMDVWRYSDWWGLGNQHRNSSKHIWHWRDWIIESLNADTPYDEMVRQMLAADELYPNDLNKLRATGYLARNWFIFNRHAWMDDTVEHVSKGLLGLTMDCAKCHDHKYDPIDQTDYYRMRAFFEPYHVRLDMLPGQPDLQRNAVPRVFDGELKTPTYRFVRGDEKTPDKSRVIEPGVPAFLAFDELEISPVTLPTEAWQPGRRPWVVDEHVATAKQKLDAAEQAMTKAAEAVEAAKAEQTRLASVVKPDKPRLASSDRVVVEDDFATLDKQRWQLLGGEWSHRPGTLEQKRDGATRAALRWRGAVPRDFDATVRFTTLGGSMWRSVGLSFDAADSDPTASAPGYYEQFVYVSAYAGGPKVQFAYNVNGKWTYPKGKALRSMKIELNREYTLRVRARGTLINVSLNGEPVIALHTPIARRDGFMQVTTFDALTNLHEVTIRELPADAAIDDAGGKPKSVDSAKRQVAKAEADLRIAQSNVEVARAELNAHERRADATRADEATKPDKHAAAIRAARLWSVAKAKHAVVVADTQLTTTSKDKRPAAEKKLRSARDALKVATATVDAEVSPNDALPKLIGATWLPTRFRESRTDDKTIPFPPTSTGRRSALAAWITDRRHPLTARVAANHIWLRHMGEPLAPVTFDLGRNAAPPANRALLDWLAAELVDSGWSMKHLHRVIVTSAAYRARRRTPIRLESQVIRDSILALAGTLDTTMGGPPVPSKQQATSKRRSLYFFHSNNERNPFLSTFDEALVTECYRREQSIKPQQALALTNSDLVLDASRRIAGRLSEKTNDDTRFIRTAFAVLLGIEASEAEIAASREALEAWRKLPNEAANARANLVWVLINHNDFVTLR